MGDAMEWGGKDGRNQAFGQALSDFTFDVACGGAIRHLAHLGYTAKEIHERLSFPVSYERVRQAYTKYLLDTGILLREKPDAHQESQTYTYVQEEGKYGKKSFRRLKKEPERKENEEHIYIACDFGRMQSENDFAALGLSTKQREYLEGICWEKRTMYHLKNERMRGIAEALAASGDASLSNIAEELWTGKKEDPNG
ncbi:MAG: hypothetical protein HDQ98_04040 [Lachnospiraceae bacterium]|nr:hypothetical protein [Lachnospiraceae bacterium]